MLEDHTLAGHNVAQSGIHGFGYAASYADYVRSRGATIFTTWDVRARGIAPVMREAMEIAPPLDAGEMTSKVGAELILLVLACTAPGNG